MCTNQTPHNAGCRRTTASAHSLVIRMWAATAPARKHVIRRVVVCVVAIIITRFNVQYAGTPVVKVSGYTTVDKNENALKVSVDGRPTSISLDATGRNWQS